MTSAWSQQRRRVKRTEALRREAREHIVIRVECTCGREEKAWLHTLSCPVYGEWFVKRHRKPGLYGRSQKNKELRERNGETDDTSAEHLRWRREQEQWASDNID